MNKPEFCEYCGASIPHKSGEGRCPKCAHHEPEAELDGLRIMFAKVINGTHVVVPKENADELAREAAEWKATAEGEIKLSNERFKEIFRLERENANMKEALTLANERGAHYKFAADSCASFSTVVIAERDALAARVKVLEETIKEGTSMLYACALIIEREKFPGTAAQVLKECSRLEAALNRTEEEQK